MSARLLLKLTALRKEASLKSKYLTFLYTILLWLHDHILEPIAKPVRQFIHGIRNLTVWFPDIWKDRQWDRYFIYRLLYKKLVLMEKFFNSKKAMTVKSTERAQEMRRCVKILERLLDDNYAKKEWENHDKKWGTPIFNFTLIEGREGYSELEIEYPNVRTEEDEEQRRKEFSELIREEYHQRQQDLDNLFKILRENVEGWWD